MCYENNLLGNQKSFVDYCGGQEKKSDFVPTRSAPNSIPGTITDLLKEKSIMLVKNRVFSVWYK